MPFSSVVVVPLLINVSFPILIHEDRAVPRDEEDRCQVIGILQIQLCQAVCSERTSGIPDLGTRPSGDGYEITRIGGYRAPPVYGAGLEILHELPVVRISPGTEYDSLAGIESRSLFPRDGFHSHHFPVLLDEVRGAAVGDDGDPVRISPVLEACDKAEPHLPLVVLREKETAAYAFVLGKELGIVAVRLPVPADTQY